jgi:DNA-binding response OmpR family regulator
MEDKKLVYVVEDDLPLCDLFRMGLSMNGYQVGVFHNGEEAMEGLLRQTPQLVILDLIMPKMNGYEFLEKVVARRKDNFFPIMVVSNLESAQDVHRTRELGANGYLVKANVSLEYLGKKIGKLFEELRLASDKCQVWVE